jgi:hypothetical protein
MGDTAAEDVPTQKGGDGRKKRCPGADAEPQAAAEEQAGSSSGSILAGLIAAL